MKCISLHLSLLLQSKNSQHHGQMDRDRGGLARGDAKGIRDRSVPAASSAFYLVVSGRKTMKMKLRSSRGERTYSLSAILSCCCRNCVLVKTERSQGRRGEGSRWVGAGRAFSKSVAQHKRE